MIGPRGSGKSANIAFWALQFYDSHCAGKSYDPVDITKPRVMEVPPPDDALLSGAATPVPGMSTPIVPPSGMGTPLIPPHVGTASPIRKGLAAFMSAATGTGLLYFIDIL